MGAIDIALMAVSLFMAYYLRFDGFMPPRYFAQYLAIVYWVIPLKFFLFFIFGLYRGMWRYTGVEDLKNLTKACFAGSGVVVGILLLTVRFEGFPRSIFPLDFVFTFILTGGVRVGIRLIQSGRIFENNKREKGGVQKRVLIVGAGNAGEKVLREIKESTWLNYVPVGFVDDAPSKKGRAVHDVPVLGGVKDIREIAEERKVQEIIIAIPSAGGARMREIVKECERPGIPYKTIPGIGELIDGRVSIKALRDVSYQDLLGRPSVDLDVKAIGSYLTNKVVLVTGAGGSIGSELCRQIIKFDPARLVLLDGSEPMLYAVQMELKHRSSYQRYRAVLGSIIDAALVEKLMMHYEPQVVFHAAAYKHVPMLERNPWQAVANNIRGCQVLLESARARNVERFVLVSTDKAVRPTNVMGASKRICELLVQNQNGNGNGRFMVVRFGNVVGSAGSVIPLFRRQIEQGGPVTVTHPEVTRFFMTIPEACQLILQAGALGEGGETFILEMGTPVKIVDMARDLIRLSGKEPDRDIEISFTGLRPGEKLYEELITEGEGIVATSHKKIMVLKGERMADSDEGLMGKIGELYGLAERQDGCGIRVKMGEILPEYKAQDSACVF